MAKATHSIGDKYLAEDGETLYTTVAQEGNVRVLTAIWGASRKEVTLRATAQKLNALLKSGRLRRV